MCQNNLDLPFVYNIWPQVLPYTYQLIHLLLTSSWISIYIQRTYSLGEDLLIPKCDFVCIMDSISLITASFQLGASGQDIASLKLWGSSSNKYVIKSKPKDFDVLALLSRLGLVSSSAVINSKPLSC